MPRHHAVLALLAGKPAHGYEFKNGFGQAAGDQWGGLDIGHLHQTLERLSRDGLIESQRQPQPVKPDRLVHRITAAGRAALGHWLSEPSQRVRGYRDDFFLKLMAAEHAGDRAVLDGVLRRQRAYLLKELRSLADARAQSPSPVDALLITAAELHARADLGVVDAAEQNLAAATSVTAATGQPAADADGAPGTAAPEPAAG